MLSVGQIPGLSGAMGECIEGYQPMATNSHVLFSIDMLGGPSGSLISLWYFEVPVP